VGAAAVNAVSDWMEVTGEARRVRFGQRYQRGMPEGPVRKSGKLEPDEETGTTTTFRYDETIFDRRQVSF
jgi:DNA gyrase subunit B